MAVRMRERRRIRQERLTSWSQQLNLLLDPELVDSGTDGHFPDKCRQCSTFNNSKDILIQADRIQGAPVTLGKQPYVCDRYRPRGDPQSCND